MLHEKYSIERKLIKTLKIHGTHEPEHDVPPLSTLKKKKIKAHEENVLYIYIRTVGVEWAERPKHVFCFISSTQ